MRGAILPHRGRVTTPRCARRASQRSSTIARGKGGTLTGGPPVALDEASRLLPFGGSNRSRARAAASGTAKLAYEVGADGHVLGEGNRALEAMAAFAKVVS